MGWIGEILCIQPLLHSPRFLCYSFFTFFPTPYFLLPNPFPMYSLNKVHLIGNVTRDPEVRQVSSGQMVCTIGVATNRSWKDQSGSKQEAVEFHNVVCWGRLAEIVGQYLRKGHKVYFEGRLQTRSWENDQGVKQYRTEIVAENMIILTPKSGSASGSPAYSGGLKAQESSAPAASTDDVQFPGEEKIAVEDLPF